MVNRGKGGKGAPVVIIPDEPREVLLPGCQVVNAVSHAVCQTGASIAGLPLYQYITNYATGGQVGWLARIQHPKSLEYSMSFLHPQHVKSLVGII